MAIPLFIGCADMSTVKAKQAAMNYLYPNQRPACSNCAHVTRDDLLTPGWWCSTGSFLTYSMAVCAEFQRREEVKS